MSLRTDFDKIELQLVRVLHTVITERSVSRAALRLHSTQPAVSAQLRRLRVLTGDPLLGARGGGLAAAPARVDLVGPGRPPAAGGRAAVRPAQPPQRLRSGHR